ncbi:hypothetical protein, partial [Lactococcus cremoris]|uniref:hypothetical protein n=1 Tax=Lactococcus lactis subsp. cremoris TaxID=1359 RepID=UPI0021AA48A4
IIQTFLAFYKLFCNFLAISRFFHIAHFTLGGGVVVPPHFSKLQKFFEFFPALPLGKIASNFRKSTFGAFSVFLIFTP